MVSPQQELVDVPVVSTDVGGISSLIRNGVTGYLTEYCRVERLSEAIISVLADDVSARQMGNNGKRVASNFD